MELDELLSRVGWSKVYFAGHIGVNERTVRDWCVGGHGGPGYRVAVRYLELVARILGV